MDKLTCLLILESYPKYLSNISLKEKESSWEQILQMKKHQALACVLSLFGWRLLFWLTEYLNVTADSAGE